ncbi:DUF3467 domain-containing protein [Candidatus Uhrbacteria bacterium CG10_big_fil_rev_8_21_14_0_10_48_11]|uniref:DUF3467 domain-containing protein n=1 Tax=Candidatus Uhrbacteria bacterium CG10_big_fil_rev_8_21_14_0_10_48_11 TaxID=1975037 RepID=A0A2M8LEW8_9BACT|nr:MAG: DUF3467 domain-containing protein [Candidatus Uhrbacteria bacterium CG10_big_fil_rev_8_21_14_0_10_48_11]
MAEQKNIQIKADDNALKGTYANLMQVSHLNEEFILDFMNVYPFQGIGTLNARVIVSPSHYKRMISAMQENLKRFEETHGTIAIGDAPNTEVGFQA